MTVQPSMIAGADIREGDILVGHNLLITPALLLDKKLRIDEGRLLDFCTMVNTLALHERVITLPAEIPEILKNSSLYQYLIKRNILHELDFDYSTLGEDEKLEMQDLLGSLISEKEASDAMDMLRHYVDKEYITDSEARRRLHGTSEYQQLKQMNNQRNDLIDSIIAVKSGSRDSIDTAISLLKGSENLVLRNENIKLHLIRTAAYWLISGKLKTAFLPDFIRIPIIAGYHAKLKQSLRMLLQSKVDAKEMKKLEDASDAASLNVIPIPSAASRFFGYIFELWHRRSVR